MAERLSHRGPDDGGAWADERAGLALAHRRLSILDLSPAGHQPMVSACGRYVLAYNGEIYNHLDLRSDLAGNESTSLASPTVSEREAPWRGHSDTETLLAAVTRWGVERAIKRLNGMFAFALWDRIEQTLYLARDRMGEKPIYYGHTGGAFLFGSELKALREHPDWRGDIDRDALALYFRHNYIPAPRSIYRGIRKVPPAHFVVVRRNGAEIDEPRCYWDLRAVAEAGVTGSKGAGSAEGLADELDALLRDSVGTRMAADVPLGAFLSGGYDSTMVVAQMQAQSSRAVRTFSIGFWEETHNEAQHAKAVAYHLGTDHTDLYVTPQQALAVIPELPVIWDEPFADSSQIPTYLVSQLASQHVTVSLSGDGGDELFYGYGRYEIARRVWRIMKTLPAGVRRGLSTALARAPAGKLQRLSESLPVRWRIPNMADRLPKLAEILGADSGIMLYEQLMSHWKKPAELVLGTSETDGLSCPEAPSVDLEHCMMYLDALTYLPDDILTKVDRATMSVSLEAREPLLDHRLVEFAWRVPFSLKFREGQGKWLLRQVLYRYVPQDLMDRPKMGFAVPVEQWLRGPLREWGEDLLAEQRLREEGFIDPAPVRQKWQEHVAGKRRWHNQLWEVLMFQGWLRASAGAR
jgi:asparagine synthase (glutamine-hydrolysing)